MQGQWIGRYAGTSEGLVVANIEDRATFYEGVAYLNEDDPTRPGIAASFRTPNKNNPFTFRTNLILPIDPRSGLPVLWDTIKGNYPADMAISTYADVTGSWDEAALTLNWTTDFGVTGHSVLPRSKAGKPSDLIPLTC